MNKFLKAAGLAGALLCLAGASANAGPFGERAVGGPGGGFRINPPPVNMAPSGGFKHQGGMPHVGQGGPMGNPGLPHIPKGTKPGGGWTGGNHPPIVGDMGKHRGHHHRHNRGFVYYTAPYFYDDYYYDRSYANDDCGWLWERYRETGLKKWKRRYYECIE